MRIFAGTLRQQELILPKNHDFRPTTAKLRMQVFNICQQFIEGANVLDMFAGSGAMGFEALSRGASHCTFVEKEKNALHSIRQNIQKLGIEDSCTVFSMDALLFLQKIPRTKPYSLVYIDPPYDLVGTSYFDTFLRELPKNLPMTDDGLLFIETRKNALSCVELPSFSLHSRRSSGQSDLWCFQVSFQPLILP